MSVKKAFRQLNPVDKSKVNHVTRVQSLYSELTEANLKKADIEKRDNKSVLQSIIDTKTEIPTDVGKVSIQWIDNSVKVAFDSGDLDVAFPRGKASFIASNGKSLRITEIEKTAEFGVVKVLVVVHLELVPLNLHNVCIVRQSGTIQKQILIC